MGEEVMRIEQEFREEKGFVQKVEETRGRTGMEGKRSHT